MLYNMQVGDSMVTFQRRLWTLARNYHALAQQQPRTLVDVARIVEMQEQVCMCVCERELSASPPGTGEPDMSVASPCVTRCPHSFVLPICPLLSKPPSHTPLCVCPSFSFNQVAV